MPVIADANPEQVELAIECRSGVRQVRRCTSRYQLPACPLRPVEHVHVMCMITDTNPEKVELPVVHSRCVRQICGPTPRYWLPACPLRPVERVDVVPVIINSNPEEIKTVLVCHRCIGGSCCAAAWNFTPAGELYVRAGYRRDTKQNKDRKDQSAQSSPWC